MPFAGDGDESRTDESAVYDTPSAFDPYNPPETPEVVQPTSPGPAQSSSAPGFGDTSGADDTDPPETQAEKDPLPEFDPKHRQPFEGLLYLGRLQKTFILWGHTFVVRTLTTEQLAEIGLIVQPYQGSNVEQAVYQSACVAAAVLTVDGQPLPSAITVDDTNELTLTRFPYVLRNWMPAVREEVYNRCFDLEIQTREVLEAMGKASG